MVRSRRAVRRGHPDRGATLVEYVLFVSGFVLIAVTAVGGLNSGARSYFQQSSSRIGQPVNRITYDSNGNRQQQASTTSITAPPSTSTTAAPTTVTTTTTTTIAPTTTRATTTTTIAPTTTTTTTTTTIAPTTTRATTTTTAAPRVVYGTVAENGSLTLTAPGGANFTSVVFASYGTPTSSYVYTKGSCDASTSGTVVSTKFVGKNTATISATNAVFGDPCSGTVKRLSVILSY